MHTLKKIDGFSVVIGMTFGAAIALVLFSFMVPNGKRMIGFYQYKMASIKAERNEKEMQKIYGNEMKDSNTMNHEMQATNPYMMASVTSEGQFLKEMKLHHEQAVVMATQVLSLQNIRPEVRELALSIIATQNSEIKKMLDWIRAWGY